MTENTTVEEHYAQQLTVEDILQAITEHYPDGPSPFQLAPIDQLHIGGIKASQKLLQKTRLLQPDAPVLEIGSGLGGLMRLMRDMGRQNVIGIDITHAFNRLNRQICRRLAVPQKAALITADAQQLPFADDQFELVVLQHSLLNIPDQPSTLRECYRVLRPGGSLLLHEVLAGPASEQMRYPVPWAREAGNSHLVVADVLESSLQAAGFHSITIDDWSADALQWRQRQHQKETGRDRPVLSPAMILGPEFKQMGANVLHNLAQDAAQVTEIMALKN